MKRLPIAIFLLVLTTLLCILSHQLLKQGTTRLFRSIEAVEIALQQQDHPTAVKAAVTLQRDCERICRYLAVFVPREKLDAIESTVTQLLFLIKENAAHSDEELARCRYRVQHLRQSERLLFTTVF